MFWRKNVDNSKIIFSYISINHVLESHLNCDEAVLMRYYQNEISIIYEELENIS